MHETLNTWSKYILKKPESLKKLPSFEENSYYSFFKNVIKLSSENNKQLEKNSDKKS